MDEAQQVSQALKGLPAVAGIDPGRRTQLRTLARRAQWAEGLPIFLDRTVDLGMRNLICYRGADGAVELVRELRGWEREAVEAREAALELALEPWSDRDADQLRADVGAMFSGFRQMRQQGEDIENAAIVLLALLRNLPAWVISKACARIGNDEAGLDKRYAPNDVQVVAICTGVAAPYRQRLAYARELLRGVAPAANQAVAADGLITPEAWLARSAAAKRQAASGSQETPAEVALREKRAADFVIAEYRRAGLEPPAPGPKFVSLAMMIKAGWTIEDVGGRKRLVSPPKERPAEVARADEMSGEIPF